MGTGCDTTLAQIAAECLRLPGGAMWSSSGADTDTSPYDSGSYASSTAFLTGGAVYKCAMELIEVIRAEACRQKGWQQEDTDYHDGLVEHIPTGERITLAELAYPSECGGKPMFATANHTCPNLSAALYDRCSGDRPRPGDRQGDTGGV